MILWQLVTNSAWDGVELEELRLLISVFLKIFVIALPARLNNEIYILSTQQ